MIGVDTTPAAMVVGLAEDDPQYCAKSGEKHAWQKLGQEDDGTWAHRCGNCTVIGTSEEEGGMPVPVRADDAAAVSAKE